LIIAIVTLKKSLAFPQPVLAIIENASGQKRHNHRNGG